MRVSVVVPTKNREQDLNSLCNSFVNQTCVPDEIVIVDQSDNKATIQNSILKSLNIIHIHDVTISGLTAAKNRGVGHCTGDIIYFFDDDIICDDDFFETINQVFAIDSSVYGVCGRQKNSRSSRIKLIAFSLFHRGDFSDIRKKCNSGYEERDLVYTNVLPGGITAYRKEVFKQFSFDEVLVKYCLGEDMDFSYRVSKKYRLAFCTKALALHNHSQIGRYDALESYACKIAGYTYFYKKNIKKNMKNSMDYKLVIVGVVVDALAYALKNHKIDSLRGIRKGHKYCKDNFKDVPFIDYEKYAQLSTQK